MSKLNRETLIKKMCESEPNLTKAAAGRLVTVMFESIKDAVANGEGASFPGFGSFTAVDTKAHTGRNPQTGETIEIPAGKKVRFAAGKDFKSIL